MMLAHAEARGREHRSRTDERNGSVTEQAIVLENRVCRGFDAQDIFEAHSQRRRKLPSEVRIGHLHRALRAARETEDLLRAQSVQAQSGLIVGEAEEGGGHREMSECGRVQAIERWKVSARLTTTQPFTHNELPIEEQGRSPPRDRHALGFKRALSLQRSLLTGCIWIGSLAFSCGLIKRL